MEYTYDMLRTLIRAHRHEGEANDSLVERVINDAEIFTSLVNIMAYSNAELLKSLLRTPSFIETL